MAETKKKYYDELNIFRAFIIVWVVIGHSFDEGNDFLGMLHTYAYSFHMPAFFILSGLLFAKKIKAISSVKDGAKLIGDRFLRLMVPYYFYTVVSIILKFFFENYANNKLDVNNVFYLIIGLRNPNGGLWFLLALFLISVVVIILYKLPALVGLVLALALHIFCIKTSVIHISLLYYIAYYSVYYYLGLVIAEYYDTISKSINEFVSKRLLVSGIVAVGYIPAAFIVTVLISQNLGNSSIYKLIIVLLNTVVYYLLAVFVNALARVKKPFMTIGNYGMDIYLIGYYVQVSISVVLNSILGAPYIVYSLSMLVFGLLLPIPISKCFVRKFRITRILALGNYKKSQPKEVDKNGEKA